MWADRLWLGVQHKQHAVSTPTTAWFLVGVLLMRYAPSPRAGRAAIMTCAPESTRLVMARKQRPEIARTSNDIKSSNAAGHGTPASACQLLSGVWLALACMTPVTPGCAREAARSGDHLTAASSVWW